MPRAVGVGLRSGAVLRPGVEMSTRSKTGRNQVSTKLIAKNPAISRRFRHVRAPCRKITHPLTPYLRKHENPSTKSKMAHFSAWLWAFRCRNVLFYVESEQITFLSYARNGAEKHVVVFGACRRNVEFAGLEIPFRSCYNGGRRMRQ